MSAVAAAKPLEARDYLAHALFYILGVNIAGETVDCYYCLACAPRRRILEDIDRVIDRAAPAYPRVAQSFRECVTLRGVGIEKRMNISLTIGIRHRTNKSLGHSVPSAELFLLLYA